MTTRASIENVDYRTPSRLDIPQVRSLAVYCDRSSTKSFQLRSVLPLYTS
jgi:hypothetical protein